MARVRRGSGVREHDLLARAKVLRGSVDSLLPRLGSECPPERFDRRRAELEEVREARDDEHRLQKLSRWGDPLARAYAGLLHFYLDPKNLAVVSFALPGGEASYAPFARTDREAEVAVQQSDDPDRLLLGYLEWARKGFHFFATRKTLFCTGPSPSPPPEFRAETIAELPYRLLENPAQRRFECIHLQAGEPRAFLEIGWPGAETAFRVCRRCAKDDRHLLSSVSEGTAGPDPSSEFPVSAEANVRCRGGPDCVHASLPPLPRSVKRDYELGKLSDSGLLDAFATDLAARVARTGRVTLIAGGICYGDQLNPFLDALEPTPVERRALEAVLGSWTGPFEVDEPRAEPGAREVVERPRRNDRPHDRARPQGSPSAHRGDAFVARSGRRSPEARRALERGEGAPRYPAPLLPPRARGRLGRPGRAGVPHASRDGSGTSDPSIPTDRGEGTGARVRLPAGPRPRHGARVAILGNRARVRNGPE